jgi:uncharacterized protein YsxB (DUF464 family)
LIYFAIELDGEKCLRRLTAEGHSFRRGEDFSPACAAVTALVRTAAILFEAERAVTSRISLPGEGWISLDIGKIPPDLAGRYRGITDFLVCGLIEISRDAPEDLEIRIIE